MRIQRLGVAAAGLVASGPALAHHVMDGALPAGLADGLLSGLGHPVIGPDHLAAILAAGALAAIAGGGMAAPLAFVAASLGGVVLHLALLTLPLAEVLVALSVTALGATLLVGRSGGAGLAALFVAAGLVHGYAFGESVVGAEATPIATYLLGLATIQAALALAAFLAVRRLPWVARPGGAVVAGIGAVSLVLALA